MVSPPPPSSDERGRKRSESAAFRLRRLLEGDSIAWAIGAHDPLGALLGDCAGFDVIWASGLELAASYGVPDADLLTMSDILEASRRIAAAVDLPILADCDAGYGNASHVAHMVRLFEAAGVAGVCVEDKAFPKVNSFVERAQALAGVHEFAGKIEAAKAAQCDQALVVMARVEALIVGLGLDEALRRSHAYADAGADAILVHDKRATPDVILEFLAAWDRPVPIVVVPTTYFRVKAAELQEAGAAMVIYANHGLRASVRAMMDVFRRIREQGTTAPIEDDIASMAQIFELQGMAQFLAHEAKYVRGDGRRVGA